MNTAKIGDRVRVHFTGSLQDGTIFDSSLNSRPLDFKIGEGKLISGFENAVIGMAEGEKKVVVLEPKDAYGEYNIDLSFQIGIENFPEDEIPEIGSDVEFQSPEGESFYLSVIDVDDEKVTFDANHPLAGQILTFEIELLEIL